MSGEDASVYPRSLAKLAQEMAGPVRKVCNKSIVLNVVIYAIDLESSQCNLYMKGEEKVDLGSYRPVNQHYAMLECQFLKENIITYTTAKQI